ncbi:hypothetical protein OEZ85_003472 [Tetradesmus obliquus]|uniref:Uncharacterized protein n=1 Tax=Tetradesmus obliquus TaxID=3088 RepID=A0ABY8UDQ7_TETOB|nr:hypothetical protein OEZ85_003472 [Tetradesmus obliquus]
MSGESYPLLPQSLQVGLMEACAAAGAAMGTRARLRPGPGPGPQVQLKRVLPDFFAYAGLYACPAWSRRTNHSVPAQLS